MDLVSNFGNFVNANVKAFSELHFVNKGVLVCLLGFTVTKGTLAVIKEVFAQPKLADDPSSEKYDKNKIYVHVLPRGTVKNIPNGSPFVVKLETWLRMVKINHEVVETMAMSRATRQIPYIFHKGKEITDSNLIIEYLEKEFGVDPSEGLNEQQLAISRAFTKMVDDSTFWTFVTHSAVFNPEKMKQKIGLPLPKILRRLILNMFIKNICHTTKVIGIGRKSEGEVYHIGIEDIKAISSYLGDKNFMMGDRMTKVDCAIFGHLLIGVYNRAPSPFIEFAEAECLNIAPYMARVKERYWPDWNKYSDISF